MKAIYEVRRIAIRLYEWMGDTVFLQLWVFFWHEMQMNRKLQWVFESLSPPPLSLSLIHFCLCLPPLLGETDGAKFSNNAFLYVILIHNLIKCNLHVNHSINIANHSEFIPKNVQVSSSADRTLTMESYEMTFSTENLTLCFPGSPYTAFFFTALLNHLFFFFSCHWYNQTNS